MSDTVTKFVHSWFYILIMVWGQIDVQQAIIYCFRTQVKYDYLCLRVRFRLNFQVEIWTWCSKYIVLKLKFEVELWIWILQEEVLVKVWSVGPNFFTKFSNSSGNIKFFVKYPIFFPNVQFFFLHFQLFFQISMFFFFLQIFKFVSKFQTFPNFQMFSKFTIWFPIFFSKFPIVNCQFKFTNQNWRVCRCSSPVYFFYFYQIILLVPVNFYWFHADNLKKGSKYLTLHDE